MYLCFFWESENPCIQKKTPSNNPPDPKPTILSCACVSQVKHLDDEAPGQGKDLCVHVFSCSVWGHKEVVDVLACLLPQVA